MRPSEGHGHGYQEGEYTHPDPKLYNCHMTLNTISLYSELSITYLYSIITLTYSRPHQVLHASNSQVFEDFDEDSSGVVDKQEFVNGMNRIGVEGLSDDEIEIVFQHFDRDGAGYSSLKS